MFPEVDPILGPEMRSTGEVLGLADSFGMAFYKSQEGANYPIPSSGTVLLSINDSDKDEAIQVARDFTHLGFNILATSGTHKLLSENNIPSKLIKKLHEGRPNILDSMTNGEIDLLINTPMLGNKQSQLDDSYIRKNAVKRKITYLSTLAVAKATVKALYEIKYDDEAPIHSLQEYHSSIR